MSSKNVQSFLRRKYKLTNRIKNVKKLSKNNKSSKIKGPWTLEEDLLLKEWVETNGPRNWKECAEKIPGRNHSQCRQHWNIKLRPDLKIGNWTSEELFLITVFYKKFNGSWSKMIPIFKSRTENSIKNIFFSQAKIIVSKLLKDNDNDNNKKRLDLSTLLEYYDNIYDETKNIFLKDNPMSENELEEYIKKIEIMLENRPSKQTYIDLEILKKKNVIDFLTPNDDNKNGGIRSGEFQNYEEKLIFNEEKQYESNKNFEDYKENNNLNNIFNNQNSEINQIINDQNDMINIIVNNVNNNNYNNICKIISSFNYIIKLYIYVYILKKLMSDIKTNIYYIYIIKKILSDIDKNHNFSLNNNNQNNNNIENNNFNNIPINEGNIYKSLSEKQVDLSECLRSMLLKILDNIL